MFLSYVLLIVIPDASGQYLVDIGVEFKTCLETVYPVLLVRQLYLKLPFTVLLAIMSEVIHNSNSYNSYNLQTIIRIIFSYFVSMFIIFSSIIIHLYT